MTNRSPALPPAVSRLPLSTPRGGSSRAGSPRGGFTIIELLMVVVVIGILVALLFPAITGAMRTAREAQVVAEISTFDKAIKDFKARYGIEPPSFIVLYESGDASGNDPSWATDTSTGLTDAHRRASRATVRQMWPDFSFSANHDINADGDITDYFILNGSECLVFFLGGVIDQVDTDSNGTNDAFAAQGFAANPQRPFDRGGNRIGPFHEFVADRFIDIDADGIPEYLDPLPDQQDPYLYLSSYDGRGYQLYGLPAPTTPSPATLDDEVPYRSSAPLLYSVYYQDAACTRPINANTYQLISPGIDHECGYGGVYNGTGVPATQDTNGNTTVDAGEDRDGNGSVTDSRTEERDNITNFKGGRLN